jgi:hypothetical protein
MAMLNNQMVYPLYLGIIKILKGLLLSISAGNEHDSYAAETPSGRSFFGCWLSYTGAKTDITSHHLGIISLQ